MHGWVDVGLMAKQPRTRFVQDEHSQRRPSRLTSYTDRE
jgi:hypothetical protein